jgi:ribosomal protein L29
MFQRLRELLSIGAETHKESEIWLQRMTYEGGWERMLRNFAQEEFHERPTSDDNPLVMTLPGRYRALRRVNGRHDEVLWEYETDDAEDYYDRQRREQNQREQMREMSIEDLHAEVWGDANELDEIPLDDIHDQYEARGGRDRLRDYQQTQLREMTRNELRAELAGQTNTLDALPDREIREELETRDS